MRGTFVVLGFVCFSITTDVFGASVCSPPPATVDGLARLLKLQSSVVCDLVQEKTTAWAKKPLRARGTLTVLKSGEMQMVTGEGDDRVRVHLLGEQLETEQNGVRERVALGGTAGKMMRTFSPLLLGQAAPLAQAYALSFDCAPHAQAPKGAVHARLLPREDGLPSIDVWFAEGRAAVIGFDEKLRESAAAASGARADHSELVLSKCRAGALP